MTTTPHTDFATLLKAYAEAEIAGYGEDETPAGILLAIREAIGNEEMLHLAHAFLIRAHQLSDPPYRIGGALCDPRLTEIAKRLRWTP